MSKNSKLMSENLKEEINEATKKLKKFQLLC